MKIWSVVEGINIDKLVRDTFLTMAAQESRATSERTHDNMCTMVKLGLWPCQPPFGYEADYSHIGPDALPLRGYIKPNPVKARIVQEMFARAASSETVYGITMWLNKDHYDMRRNGWRHHSVLYILQNKVYIGKVEYDRRANGKFAPPGKKDPSLYLCVDGKHEPIVERDVFDAVQARIALHAHQFSRSKSKALEGRQVALQGLVRCAYCGRKMRVNRTDARDKGGRKRTPGESYVFRCNIVGHPAITGPRIEKYVLQQLVGLAVDPDSVRLARTALEREGTLPRVDRRGALLAEKRKYMEGIENADVELSLKTMTRERHAKVIENLEGKIAAIDAELAHLAEVPDRRTLLVEAEQRVVEIGQILPLVERGLRSADPRALDHVAEALAHTIEWVAAEKGQEPTIVWKPWVRVLRQDQVGPKRADVVPA